LRGKTRFDESGAGNRGTRERHRPTDPATFQMNLERPCRDYWARLPNGKATATGRHSHVEEVHLVRSPTAILVTVAWGAATAILVTVAWGATAMRNNHQAAPPGVSINEMTGYEIPVVHRRDPRAARSALTSD
jgi:hypothetical protein